MIYIRFFLVISFITFLCMFAMYYEIIDPVLEDFSIAKTIVLTFISGPTLIFYILSPLIFGGTAIIFKLPEFIFTSLFIVFLFCLPVFLYFRKLSFNLKHTVYFMFYWIFGGIVALFFNYIGYV